MKNFKAFLTEVFLFEGKIDDLKAQNPGLHREIDAYAVADTSATKKFLPWLVSQHKKGNVTPDHPDLHQTIQNFDRYKNLHGIKDHSTETFQSVRDKVLPLIGGGATKAEIAEKGREKIHDDGQMQIYHVKTKEASRHFYGGGERLGGDHTDWCVSARSDECRFGDYGKMYTIHIKGDSLSPYAVHPKKNIITNRLNDGDEDIEHAIYHTPELQPAIDKIDAHYSPGIHRLATSSDISDDEVNDVMTRGSKKHRLTLVTNPNPKIVLTALKHENATKDVVAQASVNPNTQVKMAVLNHPRVNGNILGNIAVHGDHQLAIAAINHPKANSSTMRSATYNRDSRVVIAALNHPKADADTVQNAVDHPDPQVALTALNHPKANIFAFRSAAHHPNPQVAAAAKAKLK